MKDPAGEILTALLTALASIAYNGTTWHAYKVRPPRGKMNYIYLSDVSCRDASDKDHYIFDVNVNIEISVKNDKYARTISNALSNSITTAIASTRLSMTNFNTAQQIQNIQMESLKETYASMQYIKTVQINFTTQQK